MLRFVRSAYTGFCTILIAGLGFVASPAQASDCFDHYNHDAWEGVGLALVLCRNHSDDSKTSYIDRCELRYQGGARIQSLSRHGNLDLGRTIFTDYNTTGDNFNFPIDIVCNDRAGRTYTYSFATGAADYTGCCRNRECGSVSCCIVDCSDDPPPPTDAGVIPGIDAGTPTGTACPVLSSREYNNAALKLDVSLGSSTTLSFHIDAVPAPSGMTYAALSMVLNDADHPGEEGKVIVNGNSALQLPANAAWNDIDARAVLAIPVSYVRAGSNVVEFGAGTRDRTVYSVSRLALHVYGPVCESTIVDAGVPDTYRPDLFTPDNRVADLVVETLDAHGDDVESSADSSVAVHDAGSDTAVTDRFTGSHDANTDGIDADEYVMTPTGCQCSGMTSAPACLPLAMTLWPLLCWRRARWRG